MLKRKLYSLGARFFFDRSLFLSQMSSSHTVFRLMSSPEDTFSHYQPDDRELGVISHLKYWQFKKLKAVGMLQKGETESGACLVSLSPPR